MTNEYTAVVATRNRHDALALSLPLLIAQQRPPAAIIVVDSSDDRPPIRSLIDRIAGISPIPVTLIESAAGSSLQRNIGLEQVKTEVVLFPDDDSLCFPNALHNMMRIYDRDTDGVVGAVCSQESLVPPPGSLDTTTAYEKSFKDKMLARIAWRRHVLEQRYFTDPYQKIAEELWARLPPAPAWLDEENAVVVPRMPGFRMSFRTSVIRKYGFNEKLGRYALSEDVDAGFGAMRSHYIIAARNALIYHHKVPSRRTNGVAMGAMTILNHTYVTLRAADPDPANPSPQPVVSAAVADAIRRWNGYKVATFALSARKGFGRDRYIGAKRAARAAPDLIACPPAQLDDLYLDLRQRIFGGSD
ncbi:glycosyltransferase family 2 protein [Sphingomonas sp. FW199]|uniref:glycosyltransferase family 2 protein n=1 Tax=Sphingomonas sp. FW199 TaxID=3400217 RepID=UPI003CF48F5F